MLLIVGLLLTWVLVAWAAIALCAAARRGDRAMAAVRPVLLRTDDGNVSRHTRAG